MPQFMHEHEDGQGKKGTRQIAKEAEGQRDRIREKRAQGDQEKAQERESKKERWRESDRFGERIAAVGEKGHRDREDERFDGEIVRMRAVIERRRHRESRYERAPLVLVGRMKEIRHGDGSPRFAVAGSLGNHFWLKTLRILFSKSAIPARSNTKLAIISKPACKIREIKRHPCTIPHEVHGNHEEIC